jgi:hypothetical protein
LECGGLTPPFLVHFPHAREIQSGVKPPHSKIKKPFHLSKRMERLHLRT